MEFKRKRTLITGASSGIGLALARELAGRGATLILVSRNSEGLRRVSKDLSSAFPHIPVPLCMVCDVSDPEAVRRTIDECVTRLGGLDILVNNAGISVYGDALKTNLSDFRSVMDVNFFGALHCILEVLPHMREQGSGLIVNIASVAAKHGVPYLGAYCASKAALAVFSQALRAEISGSGVSAMVVYPGYTDTNIFAHEKKVGGARRPAGPYARAEKVAKSIVRAIESGKREVILSLEGKTLGAVQGLMPWLIEKAMARIASRLRDGAEVSHGKAEDPDHRSLPESRG